MAYITHICNAPALPAARYRPHTPGQPGRVSNVLILTPQRSDNDHFLYETTVEASVKDTIRELAEINNIRHRITRLKLEGEELAKYGPSKHPDKQGIDTYSEDAIERGPFYNMDPTGRRTGNGMRIFPIAASAAPSRLPYPLLDALVSINQQTS